MNLDDQERLKTGKCLDECGKALSVSAWYFANWPTTDLSKIQTKLTDKVDNNSMQGYKK